MGDRDDKTYDAYLHLGQEGCIFDADSICVRLGEWDVRRVVHLDIKDAVYFRHLLDSAIADYEKVMRG